VNFTHTPERQMLADTLKRYVLDKYDIDTRNKGAESLLGYNSQVWAELSDLGMVGALFSEQHGGFGGDPYDIAVVFEAIGQGLLLEPFLDSAILAGGVIAKLGDSQQKQRIEHIISGQQVGAFAHYEPNSRYELEQVGTEAKQQSDHWVLNGVKSVVRHAEAADFFVVSARTNGRFDEQRGISLYLVPANAAGLSVRGYHTFDGGRAAELCLSNVSLDSGALLGKADDAFPALELVISRGVLALCAESLGAMDVAKESTVEHLQSRQQFNVPIGKFQGLQHRMADMLIELEQARSAVINAAAALNKDRLTRECAISSAKYTIGCVGRQVAEEAIQMHGGMGMSWELPLGHYAKRLIAIDHELGDADHHLGRYIALNRGSQSDLTNTSVQS